MKKQKDSPTSEVYLLDSKLRRLDRPGFFIEYNPIKVNYLIKSSFDSKRAGEFVTTKLIKMSLFMSNLIKNG